MLPRSCSRIALRSLRIAPTTTNYSYSYTRPLPNPLAQVSRSFSSSSLHRATATTPTSTLMDPQTQAAQQALDQGTRALQNGELEEAKGFYEQSLKVKETSIAHYNLGVVHYQLSSLSDAITSFESSLRLTPPSIKAPPIPEDPSQPLPMLSPAQIVLADTHTNLGAAYILRNPPRPDKALEHLQEALMISPEDGEVCFNLAAVLEATGELEEAMIAFQRAEKLGIERAAINIRNLGAKLLGKKREEEEAEEKKKNKGEEKK